MPTRPEPPPLPDEDDVLWRMLNTPPNPHTGAPPPPKKRVAKPKKPAK